jgi:hypothetical protein
MRGRICGLGILLLLMIVGLAPNVFADPYTFSTTECFSAGTCSSGSNPASMNFGKDATLSFSDVGSTSVGSGTTFSLGSFDLSLLNPGFGGPYTGSFTLTVDFTSPEDSKGTFVASLLGGVFLDAAGAVITFQPDSQVFSYSGGSFTLDLGSPIVVTSWTQPVNLDGKIVSGSVAMPEGSSLTMLAASGLVLFGVFFKKRGSWAGNNAC